MGYRMSSHALVELGRLSDRLRGQAGQGTVEYVALIVLVAFLLVGVVTFVKKQGNGDTIGAVIVNKIKAGIEKASELK
jgi:Flp pilus assembly pilin Flp